MSLILHRATRSDQLMGLAWKVLIPLALLNVVCVMTVRQFGLMAHPVLEHWGVTRTEDLGRIVFTLVEVGLLVTQPGDRESDFAGVYDFHDAFRSEYAWEGIPES